jgi:hypothetical protein
VFNQGGELLSSANLGQKDHKPHVLKLNEKNLGNGIDKK